MGKEIFFLMLCITEIKIATYKRTPMKNTIGEISNNPLNIGDHSMLFL